MPFLDNRGLGPPEPMMRVLDALDQLRAGEVLEVLNDRHPIFLYPVLQAQGFDCEVEERPAGAVKLRICRREETRQD